VSGYTAIDARQRKHRRGLAGGEQEGGPRAPPSPRSRRAGRPQRRPAARGARPRGCTAARGGGPRYPRLPAPLPRPCHCRFHPRARAAPCAGAAQGWRGPGAAPAAPPGMAAIDQPCCNVHDSVAQKRLRQRARDAAALASPRTTAALPSRERSSACALPSSPWPSRGGSCFRRRAVGLRRAERAAHPRRRRPRGRRRPAARRHRCAPRGRARAQRGEGARAAQERGHETQHAQLRRGRQRAAPREGEQLRQEGLAERAHPALVGQRGRAGRLRAALGTPLGTCTIQHTSVAQRPEALDIAVLRKVLGRVDGGEEARWLRRSVPSGRSALGLRRLRACGRRSSGAAHVAFSSHCGVVEGARFARPVAGVGAMS